MKPESWSHRLHSLDDLITRSGIPRWVMADPRFWARFVMSGYAANMANGWFFRIDMLNEPQVCATVELMRALGANETDIWCSTAAHPLKETIWKRLNVNPRGSGREASPGE